MQIQLYLTNNCMDIQIFYQTKGELMRKKRVLVYGYKNLNFGDDLFFSILFKRYPQVKFVFEGDKKYKKMFKNYRNVKVVVQYSFFDIFLATLGKIFKTSQQSILEKFVNYKVLIIGSGFKECSKTQFYRTKPTSNKKLLVIGTNIDARCTETFVNLCSDYFSNCLDVCFRDSQSYNLFSELPNTRLAPDVVFDIKTYFSTQNSNTQFIQNNQLRHQKYAVISLISFNMRSKDPNVQTDYLSGVKTIINYLISKGLKIVLMGFCEAEGDTLSIDKLLKEDYIKENSYAYVYNGNIAEALAIIEYADTVIATRFHAMVLGMAMNKKTLPIVYDTKMSNVLNDLGVRHFWDFKSIKNIEPQELENWYNNYCFTNSEKLANDAKKQFSALDNILN